MPHTGIAECTWVHTRHAGPGLVRGESAKREKCSERKHAEHTADGPIWPYRSTMYRSTMLARPDPGCYPNRPNRRSAAQRKAAEAGMSEEEFEQQLDVRQQQGWPGV